MLAVSAASIIAAPDRLDGVPLEVLDLIADYLSPGTDAWRPLTPHGFAEMCSECKTSPLIEFTEAMLSDVKEQSRGAAHWLQLSHAHAALAISSSWLQTLQCNRRSHVETAACCRVLEAKERDVYDWTLEVLRLRGEGAGSLSHIAPISKHVLRLAYVRCAREVHPDRLQVGSLAHAAMTVLNEAYRQAQLYFAEREEGAVITVDALGLEH